jgi:malate synthase
MIELNKKLKEFGIQIKETTSDRANEILTMPAVKFVVDLHGMYNQVRKDLLQRRKDRQENFNNGTLPNFLEDTWHIRNSDWKTAKIPDDMSERKVEITGPPDRKMVINALNSGASCFMADFEDSCSPTWNNIIDGQVNLKDAVNRTIELKTEKKHYKLNDKTAKLMVRPRGWHLDEKHILVDGKPISASIFDFAMFMYHNGQTLFKRGETPAFYLPKLESHLEARLWNEIISMAQALLGIPRGTVRATVLIETLPAAFEMDEILWELKEHSGGLNVGRWDYIASFIKTLLYNKDFILPNKSLLGMTAPFMDYYSKLVSKTCHKRGIHAIGGMAAQIPDKSDEEKNKIAFEKVSEDKLREVKENKLDGCWCAHPGMVPVLRKVFDENIEGPNQISEILDIVIDQNNLLDIPKDLPITLDELKDNIRLFLEYEYNWIFNHKGAVGLRNKSGDLLMDDLATALIAFTQIKQWIYNCIEIEEKNLTHSFMLGFTDSIMLNLINKGYESDKLIKIRELLFDAIEADSGFIADLGYDYL